VNALDKEEFRIKLEEINKLVQDKDYKGAMNIVDSIDVSRTSVLYALSVRFMPQMEDMKIVRRFFFLHIIKHLLEKIFFIA